MIMYNIIKVALVRTSCLPCVHMQGIYYNGNLLYYGNLFCPSVCLPVCLLIQKSPDLEIRHLSDSYA